MTDLAEKATLDCRDAAYRAMRFVLQQKGHDERVLAALYEAEDALTRAINRQLELRAAHGAEAAA